MLTPNIETGLGRSDDEQEMWGIDDWWCGPYEDEETQTENPREFPDKPSFMITFALGKCCSNSRILRISAWRNP